MKFGSLFAGVGGFDLGLSRAGMTPAWSVELDPQARAVLRKHWPDVPHYEDVHDVKGATVAPVDLICGGFPCQDYSVAGKRGGLAGDRGALWWEMHRIVAECRPTWVVGENVPGLLSSNGGRDFLTIIDSLVQLGYGVIWAVLDSQYAGVAQRRRRLFVVGHSGGVPRPEILALSEGLFGHPAPSREAGEEVAGSLGGGSSDTKRGFRNDLDNHGAYPLANTLPTKYRHTLRAEGFDASEDGTGRGTPIVAQTITAEMYRSGGAVAGNNSQGVRNVVLTPFDTTQITSKANRSNPQPGDPCHPLAVGGHAPPIAPLLEVGARTNGDGHRDGDGIGEPGDPMYSLQASKQHGITGPVPRRLTPTECERLQGFPDGWTAEGVMDDGTVKAMADGPRYRMMGNAVTVNVIEWIGGRIMATEDRRAMEAEMVAREPPTSGRRNTPRDTRSG